MTQPDRKGLSNTAELYKLEKEKGWFDIRFDGWSPWRVVRTTVYNRAYELSFSKSLSKGALVRVVWQALSATSKLLISLLASKKPVFLEPAELPGESNEEAVQRLAAVLKTLGIEVVEDRPNFLPKKSNSMEGTGDE